MRYCINLLILLLAAVGSFKSHGVTDNIKVISDINYGKSKAQALDIYIPAGAKDAPVIFMVHGGGWAGGDKAYKEEFEYKVAHWVTKGFIFISTNYRTLPEARPLEQAEDVRQALIFSQQQAKSWGASPKKFILMGHSAGAHLASLVSSQYHSNNDLVPLIGTISMDSSAYNIRSRLTAKNPPHRYRQVFGEDPDFWLTVSPYYSVTPKQSPFMAICSTQSETACVEAEKFLKKVRSLGVDGRVLAIDLEHMKINSELGKNSCYTHSVDDFLKSLSPEIAAMLTKHEPLVHQGCTKV